MIRLTVIFFTARRYASAIYAVVVCPAVCHKPGLYRNDWIYIAGFLARELPLTYPKLCYKKIRVSPKIRALPAGTLPQIPDVENFATASRWSSLWITPTTVERVVAGCTEFITHWSTGLQLVSITSICSGFDLQLVPTLLCRSWQGFD